jgi:hypothetical protein
MSSEPCNIWGFHGGDYEEWCLLGCRVARFFNDVSEVRSASFIRVTRIGELGTKLAVTSIWRTLVFIRSVHRLLVTVNVVPSSPILVALTKEALPPKIRFLQEPHGVTSQKTPLFLFRTFRFLVWCIKTQKKIKKYNFISTFVWVWKLVSAIRKRI